MKSRKGIALTSLIIYVASFMMIAGVVAVITTFFYNNTLFLSSEETANTESDILSAYLLRESKIEGNHFVVYAEQNETHKTLQFTNGDIYVIEPRTQSDLGKVYFINKNNNKCFLLCNYITDGAFGQDGTSTFGFSIEMFGKTYTQYYIMGGI